MIEELIEETTLTKDRVEVQALYINKLWQQARKQIPELTMSEFTVRYFAQNEPFSWADHFARYWSGQIHKTNDFDWSGTPEYKKHMGMMK